MRGVYQSWFNPKSDCSHRLNRSYSLFYYYYFISLRRPLNFVFFYYTDTERVGIMNHVDVDIVIVHIHDHES